RALDLFDGVALAHHPLDLVDATNGGGRVEPHRALVLALAADATAARQEALLHIFAEGRLRELEAAGAEDLDDLRHRQALGVLTLECGQVALLEEVEPLLFLRFAPGTRHPGYECNLLKRNHSSEINVKNLTLILNRISALGPC